LSPIAKRHKKPKPNSRLGKIEKAFSGKGLTGMQVIRRLQSFGYGLISLDATDDVFGYWELDCGSSSVTVTCEQGNDAGWVDGGSFDDTACKTMDRGCNQVA